LLLLLVLTLRPTLQDFVTQLSRGFDGAPFGFVGFLHISCRIVDNVQNHFEALFQFRMLRQSLQQFPPSCQPCFNVFPMLRDGLPSRPDLPMFIYRILPDLSGLRTITSLKIRANFSIEIRSSCSRNEAARTNLIC
jgi:hypothetical protein